MSSKELESKELYKDITKALRRVTGQSDVSDLVQEAYCKVLERLATGETINSSAKGLLFITAKNLYINEGKKQEVRRRAESFLFRKMQNEKTTVHADNLDDIILAFTDKYEDTRYPLAVEWFWHELLDDLSTRQISYLYRRTSEGIVRRPESETKGVETLKKSDIEAAQAADKTILRQANVAFALKHLKKELREHLKDVYNYVLELETEE